MELHVYVVYLVWIFFFQNTMFLSYQKQLEIVCKTMDIELLLYIVTANCEFHCLILFISEMKEAFFNKTTENLYASIHFFERHIETDVCVFY